MDILQSFEFRVFSFQLDKLKLHFLVFFHYQYL